ncbi:chromosomal replication initiator protein DnaA [Moraxella caviae]|uniref:Chromosomal replication initiator protein DnaA n=1 Tax=Moraxella caviae TaxID=34060 RepID=A0A1S9ZXD9_9GAMM|nr:chromosomal replication initiator protein DnaA [Moraxella caviae]
MDFWQDCAAALKEEVGEQEFVQYFTSLEPSMVGNKLVLLAINEFFLKHIKQNHFDKIERLVAKHAPFVSGVDVQIAQMTAAPPKDDKPSVSKKQKTTSRIAESDTVMDYFTFSSFVKGKSNEQAYKACYDLVKSDKQADYPFLFIYGSSGLGKTHLIHAVANSCSKAGLSYCYFEKDGFKRFFEGVFADNRSGKSSVNSVIKRIMKADILMVDDVHLITSPHTSQVLLSLFDEFNKGGRRRIILASDRHPIKMEGFSSQFLSRFSGGLALSIEPPDIETRVQILEKKAKAVGLDLPKDCALFIAQNIFSDVRALEGALNRVCHSATFTGEPITLPLVRSAMRDLIEARARAINADNIREVVAEYYGVSSRDLIGKKRARNIARPRQMAMALTRELTRDSFPEIGQAFGGRDHTTVMHACEKVQELCETDPLFYKDYTALKATLQL